MKRSNNLKKIIKTISVVSFLLISANVLEFANANENKRPPKKAKRIKRQLKKRIAEGKQSGTIDRKESRIIKKEMKQLKKMLKKAKRNDGKVTKDERKEIHEQVQSISKKVAVFKNNEHNQKNISLKKRIKDGIKSGELDKFELEKLKKFSDNLKQMAKEMKESGGELTDVEKKILKEKKESLSQKIYDYKHNDKKRLSFKNRIKEGVKSGELDKLELEKLKILSNNLKEMVKEMKESGGELTDVEKKIIAEKRKQYSELIFKLKHNDKKKLAFKARVKEGVESGELDKFELQKLKEAKKQLKQLVKKFKESGEELTAAEKKIIAEKRKQYSELIFKLKHNEFKSEGVIVEIPENSLDTDPVELIVSNDES